MGKLNMKDWIGQTILNKKVISIPIMTHPGIELIGKTVHDAVTNGQVHYEAIKALCDKYPARCRNGYHGFNGRGGSIRSRNYISGE
ncbi:hypothetical protein NXW76_15670 [Bacteroides thetaiotaomicron]|nr:hypothetical protein [Bacteroides thetaiotaomicron]